MSNPTHSQKLKTNPQLPRKDGTAGPGSGDYRPSVAQACKYQEKAPVY